MQMTGTFTFSILKNGYFGQTIRMINVSTGTITVRESSSLVTQTRSNLSLGPGQSATFCLANNANWYQC
jgi:hypothetical protein